LRTERQAREAEERQRQLEQQRRQDPENFTITSEQLARYRTNILNNMSFLNQNTPVQAALNNPSGYIVTGYPNNLRVNFSRNWQILRQF
jgi:hypothetical protein